MNICEGGARSALSPPSFALDVIELGSGASQGLQSLHLQRCTHKLRYCPIVTQREERTRQLETSNERKQRKPGTVMSFRLMWIELKCVPAEKEERNGHNVCRNLFGHRCPCVAMPSLSSEESDNHVCSCPDEADD